MDYSEKSRQPGFTADFRRGYIDEMLASGKPLPFYFKLRLVHKGPFVACKIGRICACTVNGGDDNADHEWEESCDRYPQISALINGVSHDLERAIRGGQLQTIKKADYDYLLDSAKWDAAHDQDSPLATPEQQINLGKMRPVF